MLSHGKKKRQKKSNAPFGRNIQYLKKEINITQVLVMTHQVFLWLGSTATACIWFIPVSY